MLYIKDKKISPCTVIEHNGSTIFNPTHEQIIAAGWAEYVTPEVVRTNDDVRLEREMAYKAESDSLYMAWQKYTALGESEKAETARLAWLEKVAEIDERIPYIE